MILTILVTDNAVGINGVFRTVTLPSMPGIHAVQWNGISGHIERTDFSNAAITDVAAYQSIIDAWNALTPTPAPPPTLAQAQATQSDLISTALVLANLTNFTYSAKSYSADQSAQNNLNAIANYASLFSALPSGFPGGWVALDKSILPIPDVATFKLLYSAMVAQGAANFVKMQNLLGQIAASTTASQAQAVVW